MIKKILFLLMILLNLFIISGCRAKDITERSFVTGIGIDKVEEEYIVSVQMINAEEIATEEVSDRAPIVTYSGNGHTILGALRKITLRQSFKVNGSQNDLIVISESCAKEGINELLDIFFRDHEIRGNSIVLIAKDSSAMDILSTISSIATIPTDKIKNSLKVSNENYGSSKETLLRELGLKLYVEGIEATITGVTLLGDKEKGKDTDKRKETIPNPILEIDNIGVFNGDKLVGWLSKEEGKAYNYITNNIKSTIENINYTDNKKVVIEIGKAKSKIKSEVIDGVFKIKIDTKVNGAVGENYSNINLRDEKSYKELEEILQIHLEEMMRNSIEHAKEYESDIFGFGKVIYRKYPKIFNKYKSNWNEVFKYIDIDINVKAKIKTSGNSYNSLFNIGK